MEIRGNYFVITGSNRGIGRAVAEMAAQSGAHLILCNRSLDADLADELTKLGAASVEQIQSDLGSRAGVDSLLKTLNQKRVDILFNNAGQLTGGLLENQPTDDIYQMLQVNVNALIHLTQGILPQMLKARRGKIINHSSVSAVMHFPCASTYAASKAAVLAFTNCLRAELQGTGVSTLVLITPGVETRMYNDIPGKYGKNLDVSFLQSIPTKKYAEMIKEAILEDLNVLEPHGFMSAALGLAKHAPGIFQKIVSQRFKRTVE